MDGVFGIGTQMVNNAQRQLSDAALRTARAGNSSEGQNAPPAAPQRSEEQQVTGETSAVNNRGGSDVNQARVDALEAQRQTQIGVQVMATADESVGSLIDVLA